MLHYLPHGAIAIKVIVSSVSLWHGGVHVSMWGGDSACIY